MNKCVSILVGNYKKEKETIKKNAHSTSKKQQSTLESPSTTKEPHKKIGQHHKPRHRQTPSFQTPLSMHA
jgi:hypothetical protein